MSRISSTFGKQAGLRSSVRSLGGSSINMSRISQPLGSQGPAVYDWSRKLRSRSPSPSRLSNTESKGAYLTDVPSRSPSMLKKDSSVNNAMRKSTGNLAAAFSGKVNKSHSDLTGIEAEYIKNLQQQIYFLELEANYLRNQTKKATDMHPQMTAEAEHMLTKLRQMQSEMDGMHTEMRHRESGMAVANAEKEKLEEQQMNERDTWQREKRLLTDELITFKKEKDRCQREVSRKDTQLLEAKSEVDKSASAIRNAELQITTLKSQLDQRVEQHKLTQLNLEEKRSELLTVETQLRELEEKYYSSTITIQDKVTQDLRDEIRYLRQKLKETELAAEKDRYLRDKVSEDSSHLVKENAMLNQQISELQKQMERERGLRESNDQRHSDNIAELVNSRDKEKQLQFEREQLREQLRRESEKGQHYLEELTKKETTHSSTEHQLTSAQNRMGELEGMQVAADAENTQLRRDKLLLVDHVADLQAKLEMKDREVLQLQHEIVSMEARLNEFESDNNLEHTVQSQKWEEFGRLAESMRTLSHTMAAQSVTPRSSTKILRY
ncbi:ELKS/Rab6-interacting/CAST family member 1-like isoform X1 [Haliotis rubra]|uniref:ELKS/Rab6-interacting/CAST family member 1-like isoform X1 n=1 Tax=Haliotis rubra TaxID=36100 RepID=UPI001EE5660C|nr:ELKS/Rab6-interacting/CAST family member 1-like isoform X1 [Haliotis rubra]